MYSACRILCVACITLTDLRCLSCGRISSRKHPVYLEWETSSRSIDRQLASGFQRRISRYISYVFSNERLLSYLCFQYRRPCIRINQCGGIQYTGPTCCTDGYTCTMDGDEWFLQVRKRRGELGLPICRLNRLDTLCGLRG